MSTEHLQQIEDMASLFFKPAEIEVVLEMDPRTLLTNPETKKAFHKGYLLGEFTYWKDVKRLADSGSSPAQELLYKRMMDLKTKLVDAE